MPGGRIKFDPSYGPGLTALVESPPDRGGGMGGWQLSERARRRPGKWFKAQPDDTYSWDLILDIDEVGGGSIEDRLGRLRDMGTPHDGHDEPPTVTLAGDVWGMDTRLTWVIDDVTLGDRLYAHDGDLRRQHITVAMSRYNEIDEVEAIRIRRTRGGKGGKQQRHRTIVVKKGDTLRTIALRELGQASRWKDLKEWNKKKLKKVNPDSRLRAGLHLRVN